MDLDLLIPLVATLITLVGVIGMAARSLRTTSQAIGDLSQTNIELNKELKETARERHAAETVHEAERETWKAKQNDMQCQLDAVNAKLTRVESDLADYSESSKQVIEKLSQELVKVNRELEAARLEVNTMKGSISDLTAALKTAQEQLAANEILQHQWKADLADAKRQIAILQRDNQAKDYEIKALQARVQDLESKLEKSENERDRLESEKNELLVRLATLESEPGESDRHEQPEMNEEKKADGT